MRWFLILWWTTVGTLENNYKIAIVFALIKFNGYAYEKWMRF